MEFDDLNLKPTFKILWGVPGLATDPSRFSYPGIGWSYMFHSTKFENGCQVVQMQ